MIPLIHRFGAELPQPKEIRKAVIGDGVTRRIGASQNVQVLMLWYQDGAFEWQKLPEVGEEGPASL